MLYTLVPPNGFVIFVISDRNVLADGIVVSTGPKDLGLDEGRCASKTVNNKTTTIGYSSVDETLRFALWHCS